MTEKYWQRYKETHDKDPLNTNELWVRVKQDLKRREKPKHHLELYSYCRTENPYIKQIKSSPNITMDTVAELICRQSACELQYCMSLQKLAVENSRSKIDLQGCRDQYKTMTTCIMNEKNRIKQKEEELRNLVLGLQQPEIQQEPQKQTILKEEPVM
ncbi:unnamed protein product [Paramecium primaurelia]|uniref:Uncharacterized protein n=2 Tax=Paramecium TaxID=5884 RepID=A0A8S1S1Z9_9CILI|nr:unnamed protein product [Paramecium primaurelia]CAD8134206.1 unnamed protein product [Paramecium pentaurelia]